jgi:protein-S-isoprenylcysteine O-methyltransferase Ste14
VLPFVRTVSWLACVVYSTIPAFWLVIHPYAGYWRARRHNPYKTLLPLWLATWVAVGALTWRWRWIAIYDTPWTWLAAAVLFIVGISIYIVSVKDFGGRQLGGVPEIVGGNSEQRLITAGIRGRVRHPVYLGHFCEMLAWSIGSGLAVNFALSVFAVITGAVMVRMEDKELEERFGDDYRAYKEAVPAVLPGGWKERSMLLANRVKSHL